MKTTIDSDRVSRVIERDETAMLNLRALAGHNRTVATVATVGGQITLALDPVIYGNVHDAIVRLALRRYYKAGRA